jgi:uncharacterized repeat protein (TIGR01451 family)
MFALLPAAQAQVPCRCAAPLLFVRFSGAPTGRVTVYRGDQGGPRQFEFPVTLGFRPGYIYRLKIEGLPGQTAPVYPTLEVRGSLFLPPKIDPADHPAPFGLTDIDAIRVFEGVFLTKVIYLEDPEKAVPAGTRPGQLIERTVNPGDDPLDEARHYGRPVAILRVGERPIAEADLIHQGIPGTILYPTEKSLALPRVPPCIPFLCAPLYDPVLGPKCPEEECLHDGGDTGHLVGIGPGGMLEGLDPTDTVAEYTDSHGHRHVMPSNRVCLCVPRFAAIVSELPLAGYAAHLVPARAEEAKRQVQVNMQLPSLAAQQYEHLNAVRIKERASTNVSETGVGELLRLVVLNAEHVYEGPALALGTAAISRLTEVERVGLAKQIEFAKGFSQRSATTAAQQSMAPAVVGRVEGLGLYTATLETCDVTAVCSEPPQLLVDKPMHLFKWADRQSAQIGDVVTFYLKYSNACGKPIEDVAVSDSLSGRLEYVPDSARTDRNAVFTMQANEAGSVILRWEISGKLQPGQSGVIRFQARVR